jgi:Uma2 family endonuclease
MWPRSTPNVTPRSASTFLRVKGVRYVFLRSRTSIARSAKPGEDTSWKGGVRGGAQPASTPCYDRWVVPSARRHRYTYQEYLAFERSANVRHEFFDGEIYAMAGGTRAHAAISANISSILRAQLRGRGCQAHSSDLRIRVLETGLATYPDVTIVCKPVELDPEDRNTVINPTLVVEVLSPSSAAYDRGEKLEHYKRVPSLREVVLVAHDEPLIEVWRRGDDGAWSRREARNGTLALTAVDCTLTVEDVYSDELATT